MLPFRTTLLVGLNHLPLSSCAFCRTDICNDSLTGWGSWERHPPTLMVCDLRHADGFLVETAVDRREGVYGLPIPPNCLLVSTLSWFYSLYILGWLIILFSFVGQQCRFGGYDRASRKLEDTGDPTIRGCLLVAIWRWWWWWWWGWSGLHSF